MGDRWQRVPQRIDGVRVLTAHRDFADICPGCGGYIERGQWYVKSGKETLHYRCRGKGAPKVKAAPRPSKKIRRERQAERRRNSEVISAQFKDRADSMNRFDYAIDKE